MFTVWFTVLTCQLIVLTSDDHLVMKAISIIFDLLLTLDETTRAE